MVGLVLLVGCATLHGYQPVAYVNRLPEHSFTTPDPPCPYSEIATIYVEAWDAQTAAANLAASIKGYEVEGLIGYHIGSRIVPITVDECDAGGVLCWDDKDTKEPGWMDAVIFYGSGSLVRWHCPDEKLP